MRFKRLLTIVVRMLVVTLITGVMIFAVLEFSLARGWLTDMRPVIPLVDDPILKHRVDLSFTDVDTDGWRNHHVLERADIVAIGDSQTYGVAALRHKAYPQQLAQLTGLDVYNLALGGYGPVEYAYLMDLALEKQPDTITIGVYLGNDVLDCQYSAQSDYWQEQLQDEPITLGEIQYDANRFIMTASGEVVGMRPFSEDFLVIEGRALEEANNTGNGFRSLLNSSRVISFLWYGYVRPIMIPPTSQFAEIVDATMRAELQNGNLQATVAYQDDNIMITLTPFRRWVALNLDSEAVTNGYEICQNRLEVIHERCIAESVRCLFIIIPTKELTYYPYLKSQGFEVGGYFVSLVEMEDRMRQQLTAFFEELDADMIDVTTVMQDAAITQATNKQLLYPFHYDSHPNANGYQIIAQAIADYLSLVEEEG